MHWEEHATGGWTLNVKYWIWCSISNTTERETREWQRQVKNQRTDLEEYR